MFAAGELDTFTKSHFSRAVPRFLQHSRRWKSPVSGLAILAGLSLAVSLVGASGWIVLSSGGGENGLSQQENRDDPSRNLYWRLTKNGWQYVYIEPPELVPAVIQPAFPPAVHPAVVTMLIALAALAAVAWASDEWDWQRMVGE